MKKNARKQAAIDNPDQSSDLTTMATALPSEATADADR
jgi:hypothetical protein